MARPSSAQLVSFAERTPVEATPAAPVVLAPVELPPARRPGWPTLASLAIASGLVALALGAWAIVSGVDDGPAGLEGAQLDRALSLLAAPGAERIPFRGSVGRIVLVADRDGAALLSVRGLAPAPGGYDYEAWVVPPGSATPVPAATFDGTQRIVLLSKDAPPGARVAVTLEADGGSERPTRPLRLVAERAP
ncbi:MAG TPA: anti-sigma factor [Gaiella sp.]